MTSSSQVKLSIIRVGVAKLKIIATMIDLGTPRSIYILKFRISV